MFTYDFYYIRFLSFSTHDFQNIYIRFNLHTIFIIIYIRFEKCLHTILLTYDFLHTIFSTYDFSNFQLLITYDFFVFTHDLLATYEFLCLLHMIFCKFYIRIKSCVHTKKSCLHTTKIVFRLSNRM